MPNFSKQVPKYDELMYPTVRALKALGGSGTIEEIVGKVAELEQVPQEVQEIMSPDGRRTSLEYRLAWARNYLKSVGAVVNSGRGVWSLTDKGAGLSEQDCLQIPAIVRKQGHELRKLKSDEKVEIDSDQDEELGWKDLLLDTLKALKPDAFERLAQRLLREAGFVKVEVMGKSGDGGIDGIGILRVNLVSFTVLFQCKKYKESVGAPIIRDFRGAMQGRCDKGLVITTGTFTADAKKEATRDGAPAIDLIDGDALCELLKELKLGVAVEQVEKVSVRPAWFDEI